MRYNSKETQKLRKNIVADTFSFLLLSKYDIEREKYNNDKMQIEAVRETLKRGTPEYKEYLKKRNLIIIAKYQNGTSMEDLAEEYHFSMSHIKNNILRGK